MRILFIASSNNKRFGIAPFTAAQCESIRRLGHQVDVFQISGKGWKSYFNRALLLRKKVKTVKYDVIHAHFIWSCLVAVMQRRVPVVASFLGCDLNKKNLRFISKGIIYRLSRKCIVVNEKMLSYLPAAKTVCIPHGIDMDRFIPCDKAVARQSLDMNPQGVYILFCSTFDRIEKNSKLAREAVALVPGQPVLIEFFDFSDEQLPLLYSAVDLLLMTSIREGSPMVIKEAMAANCPIVSTDVGDVRQVIGNTQLCFITGFNANEIAEAINQILAKKSRTNGRERMLGLGLSLQEIAVKIERVYKEIVN